MGRREGGQRGPVLVYVLLTFGVTWAVWVPRAAVGQGWLDADVFVALGSFWTYGPAVAAVLTAAWAGGRRSLRDLGSRLVRWRVGWWGWAAVIVVPALFWTLTGAFATVVGAGGGRLEGGLVGLVPLVIALSLTDGLGEEVGWRGWMLPRLLERQDALLASLLLGVVWAAWHLPLHWTPGGYLADVPAWVLFLKLPATAVVFTWVFRHARGSVLVAVVLHGVMNAASAIGPGGMAGALAEAAAHWLVAAAVLALAGRGLDRWPGTASPAVPVSGPEGRPDPTSV